MKNLHANPDDQQIWRRDSYISNIKYKGNTTSDTFSPDFLSFSAIYSLLLPHITHVKTPIFPW